MAGGSAWEGGGAVGVLLLAPCTRVAPYFLVRACARSLAHVESPLSPEEGRFSSTWVPPLMEG